VELVAIVAIVALSTALSLVAARAMLWSLFFLVTRRRQPPTPKTATPEGFDYETREVTIITPAA
jgi:hypothetical protein